MIDFTIDPPSGHSHSALDISFKIKKDLADQSQIEIWNQATEEKLDILSVSNGYIKDETTIIANDAKLVEGHFNLFNKDKLNDNLKDYTSVDLKCIVVSVTNGESIQEDAIVTFYNESQSLDAEIIPFDLVVDNPEIDLKRNLPLSMQLVCDTEQRFELAIRSENGKNSCTFEVVACKGRTEIRLPSEIIWNDIGLSKKHLQKFHVYWVKFEGVNHMNVMNRKYIVLPNTRLTFNTTTMEPKPQPRQGPTGAPLPPDFVISHKYFVHTWKAYTAIGNLPIAYSKQKMLQMSRFMHEIQSTQSTSGQEVSAFSKENDDGMEIRKAIRESVSRKHYRRMDPKQKIVVEAFAKPYVAKSILPATDRNYVQTFNVKPITSPPPKKKGCGCSRKSNA